MEVGDYFQPAWYPVQEMPPQNWEQRPVALPDALEAEQEQSDRSRGESDEGSLEQEVRTIPDDDSTRASQVLTLLSANDVR